MDVRAAQAREAHRRAAELEDQADQAREQRDHLVRALRAEDPGRWTYANLAKAVGCTPETVAAIVQGRTGKKRRRQS